MVFDIGKLLLIKLMEGNIMRIGILRERLINEICVVVMLKIVE